MTVNLNKIEWETFKRPPKSAGPMVRWWWTGLDVDKDEVLRELDELDKSGFYGAEVQCFTIGLPKNLTKKDPERARRTHRFMTPFYYDIIKTLLDEASKRNMAIDLTIGAGWPAGGTHISKEQSLKGLFFGQKVIKGARHYKGEIPKLKKPLFYRIQWLIERFLGLRMAYFFENDMKLERVIAAKPIGKPGKFHFFRKKTSYLDFESIIDITKHVNNEDLLDWDVPEGKWQIFSFFKGPSGMRLSFNARPNVNADEKSLVLDHFASNEIQFHLDLHFGKGKEKFGEHFGKTLRAFFTDSLELMCDWYWTDDFLDEFKKRRGYDLSPYLPVCFIFNKYNKFFVIFAGSGVPSFDFKDEEDINDRIRYDLDKTISDLFIERFLASMAKWGKNNDLLNRIQAYGIIADTLKAYGTADIPETEQIFAGGMLDFLKLAGSAGAIYEKPIVSCESLGWNMREYLTTPLKWKVAADRLFVSGINQMIYHGLPYKNPNYPYPGFHPFSTPYMLTRFTFSADFSRYNPFYEFFPLVNSYISRCQYILQNTKLECDVGIFYPLFNYSDAVLKQEEMVGGCLDESDVPLNKKAIDANVKEKLDDEEMWTLNLINLGYNLMENGYYYVHINEDSLLKANIDNKLLCVGECELKALIFQDIDALSLPLVEKLRELASNDFPIIFINNIPDRQPGFFNHEENDEKIKEILNKELKGKISVINKEENVATFLEREMNVKPRIKFDKPQPTVHFIHKEASNSDFYFIRHCENSSLKITSSFLHGEKVPFKLNPWTGEITQLSQYKKEGNIITTDIYFNPYESILLEFREEKEEKYIIKSPIKTERTSDGMIGLIDTPGKYVFELNDSSREEITITGKDIAEEISITSWKLKTKLRSHDGEERPLSMNLKELKDWREIKELKYCSFRGIYSSTFHLSKEMINKKNRILLSVGKIYDVGIVKINGKSYDPLFKHPFTIDITESIKEGENSVEIEVVPTIRNRLVGYGKKQKEWKQFKKKRLAPTGLIGPVTIFNKRLIKF